MFTQNRIDFSAAVRGLPVTVDVMRDCSFSYVGKIPTNLNSRIVPAVTAKHIEDAAKYAGIAGIITKPELESLVPRHIGLALADDPVIAALHLHEKLCAIEGFQWEHFDSRIHPTAKIHASAVIAERDVVIGQNAVVGPTSVVLERTILEESSRLGVGVVAGLDAFEIFDGVSPRRILTQAGGVWLEPGATVLAHCTLVRATFGGFTRLARGAMVDVLIHVAHDVIIGENATIVACAEISGRCEIGEGAYVGPNACIRNGVNVGRNATVSMGSVVTRDVPDDTTVTGNFAVEHDKWLNFMRTFR